MCSIKSSGSFILSLINLTMHIPPCIREKAPISMAIGGKETAMEEKMRTAPSPSLELQL